MSGTARPDVVVTGLGRALGAPSDPLPWLRVRKNRKLMGLQDDLAVVAAGRALESAGLAGASLGERAGLYVAVGSLPFERTEIDAILAASVEDGRFSMERFSTRALAAVSPLLTFRCLPNMPAFHVSAAFDVQGPSFVTYPGPGQLYVALEEACAALASGALDLALVLGVAAQRNFLVEHHHARLDPPVAAERLGDAAGCLVLETEAGAASRGARARARPARIELAYAPHDPFARAEHVERVSGAPAPELELGPASLPVALASAGPGTVLHELSSRDGLRASSAWEVS